MIEKPVFHIAGNKKFVGKLILFFHDYSVNPSQYENLENIFNKEDLPYVIPLNQLFGLASSQLLSGIKFRDWIQEAIQAYDIQSSIASDVYVVGHSLGSLQALAVAAQRPVKKVILIDPPSLSSYLEKAYGRLSKQEKKELCEMKKNIFSSLPLKSNVIILDKNEFSKEYTRKIECKHLSSSMCVQRKYEGNILSKNALDKTSLILLRTFLGNGKSTTESLKVIKKKLPL